MARAFDAGEYAEANQTTVTDYPMTMSIWFYPTNSSANGQMFSICDKDTNVQYVSVVRLNSAGGNKLRCQWVVSTGYSVDTTTTQNYNAWNHGCIVATNSTDRAVFLNGGGKNTDTTSVSFPSGIDRVSINRIGDSTPSSDGPAYLAEAAIWSVALTDDEVTILSKGYSPPFVRPQSLVFYAPVIGRTSPEIELVSGFNMAITGTTTAEAHPPVMYPWLGQTGLPQADLTGYEIRVNQPIIIL